MPDTNKVFQTRIQLKYDSYKNWLAADPILKKGEMAIATVDQGDNDSLQNLPNVVLKIGDGASKYSVLPFVSGLAADVYAWAKAATKPSYAASEISGLQAAIEQYSDYDTNTQYKIVQAVNEKKVAIPGKYQLQSKELGGDWQNVTDSLIDVTDAFGRIATLETTVEGLTGGAGSIASQIDAAIKKLNATVSNRTNEDAVNADGLDVTIIQENGALKSVTATIKEGTYDVVGAAAAVLGKDSDTAGASTVFGANKAATAAQTKADEAAAAAAQEATDRATAISNLSYTGYEAGDADNSETISFVGTISEANGVISATKRDLKFKTAYNSENNKVATEADVNAVVEKFSKSLTYKGMKDELPTDVSGYQTGDVIIVGTLEYIFDGTKFDQFGDEGVADAVKKSLTSAAQEGTSDETITSIVQTNGMVTATRSKISITGDQVKLDKEGGTEGEKETLTERLASIKNGASADVTALEEKVNTNKAAIDVLNGDVKTAGSVDKKINDKVVSLVSTVSQDAAEANGQLALTVVQENGTLKSVSGSIKAGTYDAAGAAAAVLGDDADTVEDKTVYGAFAAAAAAQKSADNAASAITKLTSDGAVATETQTNGKFGVLTQVKQTNGAVSKGAEVMLHKVAASGKIDDLDQTAYVIFDCGSATEVM